MKRLAPLLLLFVLAPAARGQDWVKLWSPAGTYGAATGPFDPTPYFLNAKVGFVYCANINKGSNEVDSSTHLNRTQDGGSTWTPISYFDTIHCAIRQIYFVSMRHGYVAGSCGVFETFDTGGTWKEISQDNGYYTSVYAIGAAVFAAKDLHWDPLSQAGNIGPLYCSRDDGATWTEPRLPGSYGLDVQAAMPPFVFGNKENMVCYETFDMNYDFRLYVSTDSGKTWFSNLLDVYPRGGNSSINATEGLYCVPHCSTIFRTHATGLGSNQNTDTYDLEETTDYGQTWRFILNRETGAWLVGNPCSMYLSDAQIDSVRQVPPGPLRSTNGGSTWLHVEGGPVFVEVDDEDHFNMSAVGGGAVLYAGDQSNQLWKTTDGGDGALSEAALAPHFALGHSSFGSGTDTLAVPNCQTSQMVVTNFNIGCSWATFDSVTLDGLTPAESSITSTHYCGCTHLPDTSFILISPKKVGIRNVTVHFHYTDDEYNRIDTTLPIVLDVQAGGTSLPLSLSLGSGTMVAHAGDTIGIPIYLTSDSTITFDTVSMMLPFSIDTSVLKVLNFVPAFGGDTLDSVGYVGGTETVPLQIANLTVAGRTLIGTLRCVVYLVDTLQTSISLQGANIDANTGGCIALSTELAGVNIAITGCGDSTLLRFMRGEAPFGIESVIPNPASTSLTVRVESAEPGGVNCQLFDALGNCVLTQQAGAGTAPLQGTGTVPLQLDVSKLANGIYFLRLSSGGYAVSRSVAIER